MNNEELHCKVIETSVMLQQNIKILDSINNSLEKIDCKLDKNIDTVNNLQKDVLKLSINVSSMENKLDNINGRVVVLEDNSNFNVLNWIKQSVIPVSISAIFVFLYEKFRS